MLQVAERPRLNRYLAGFALALALTLGGCGGPSSPSRPAVTAPAVVPVTSMRDGITGAPIAASVTLNGGVASVTAAGYLPREQPSADVVWLWPQSEDYVRATVYTSAASGAAIPLYRWSAATPVRLAFAAGLQQHDAILRESAAEMTRLTRLTIVALAAGDPSANVVLSVDAAAVPAGFSAYTRLTAIGAQLTSGTIAFYREAAIENDPWRNLVLHELGHVLGLGHSPEPRDVMSSLANRTNERAFGEAEGRALTMMYSWRKAGNQFPDREPAGLTSAARVSIEIACGR